MLLQTLEHLGVCVDVGSVRQTLLYLFIKSLIFFLSLALLLCMFLLILHLMLLLLSLSRLAMRRVMFDLSLVRIHLRYQIRPYQHLTILHRY